MKKMINITDCSFDTDRYGRMDKMLLISCAGSAVMVFELIALYWREAGFFSVRRYCRSSSEGFLMNGLTCGKETWLHWKRNMTR